MAKDKDAAPESGPGGDRDDGDPVARLAGLTADLDREGTGVAVFAPDGRLVHANASLRRFLAGRDPEAALQPDDSGRVHLPDGRTAAVRRLPLAGGAWAVLVPSPKDDADFLRQVLDSIDTSTVVYDAEDRYLFGNVAYHRRYPHLPPEEELVGQTFEQMLRRTIAAGAFADAQAEHDPDAFVRRRVAEFRANQPGMTERMTDSGEWEKVRVVTTRHGLRLSLRTRITEIKRVQDALRQAKERLEGEASQRIAFVRRLGHEFRTPLSAVLGYSEMIEQEVLGPLPTPKYRDYASLIHQSGQHLLELVSGLTDEADDRRPVLREEAIDLADLLGREIPVVAPIAQAGAVQLVVAVEDTVPRLRGDPRMVRQMLFNLLSNAVRFSPGGIVSTSAVRREDGGIAVRVEDNGVGIRPEVLARLGEPYYRGPDSPGQPTGTGLGLGVVKELIALHQGRLVLDSVPDKGTTAILEFPPERSVAPDEPLREKAPLPG
ncbi:ATP-binding protein [Stella sp.]|uniref:sensor histidine kinase n=1 Tax=Stella sp. TaxID=2912054 RepID=UPI0035B4DE23